jgi:hypothetical protein
MDDFIKEMILLILTCVFILGMSAAVCYSVYTRNEKQYLNSCVHIGYDSGFCKKMWKEL